MRFRQLWAVVGATGALTAAGLAPATSVHATYESAAPRSCGTYHLLCAEVADQEAAFGEGNYVGHDEPASIFYSNKPGSGNRAQYHVTLPKDPAGAFSKTKSYNMELHPTFWYSMVLCDTQSYPEQVHTCTPDSDANIPDPTQSANFPGSAFMELQFYPPGGVPQFTGFSCDPTKWCAAMTIDSLSEDPVAGQDLNASCADRILGGVEYVNFAYVTKSFHPQGPPDPLNFDFTNSGHPGSNVLFMNQGDNITVTMADTPHGVGVVIKDATSGQIGGMVASANNGFGQIKFDPTGTSCQVIPYDFHPMFSTSTQKTVSGWTAHSMNVGMSDEIGHFDFCTHIDANSGSCDGLEGPPGDQEPADGDDNACFGGSSQLLYPVTGCLDSNIGYDGPSYQHRWPNGNTAVNPTPIQFTSPTTGAAFKAQYPSSAFENINPANEAGFLGTCSTRTGQGCTLVPPTDDGSPATFYPYFTAAGSPGSCQWQFGEMGGNNFGGTSQYGQLYKSVFLAFGGGGATRTGFEAYHHNFTNNPCTTS